MSRGVVSLGLVTPPPAEPPPDDGEPAPITGPLSAGRSRPGGLAVSGILHVLVVALVVDMAIAHAPEAPVVVKPVGPSKNAVFMPPPAQVRRMLGLPPPKPAPPAPAATPVPPAAKDRISIGPPSTLRQKVLELHRDTDLTQAAKGTPNPATATPPPAPAPTPPPSFVRDAGRSVGEAGPPAPTPVQKARLRRAW